MSSVSECAASVNVTASPCQRCCGGPSSCICGLKTTEDLLSWLDRHHRRRWLRRMEHAQKRLGPLECSEVWQAWMMWLWTHQVDPCQFANAGHLMPWLMRGLRRGMDRRAMHRRRDELRAQHAARTWLELQGGLCLPHSNRGRRGEGGGAEKPGTLSLVANTISRARFFGSPLPPGESPLLGGLDRRLSHSWSAMSPRRKRVLHLFVVRGLDGPEVCELLGCTLHTMHSTLKRGLDELRARYQGEYSLRGGFSKFDPWTGGKLPCVSAARCARMTQRPDLTGSNACGRLSNSRLSARSYKIGYVKLPALAEFWGVLRRVRNGDSPGGRVHLPGYLVRH